MRVRLINHMGDDLTVANAARRSFDTEHEVFRTREMGPRHPRERSDEELIEDMGAEGDTLPFRHLQLTIECDAPIPIARQLGKHQVGLSWSEVSRRYKTTRIEFHRLDGTWRAAPEDRRHGTGELLPPDRQELLRALQENNIALALLDYEAALALGVSPEQARFLLPQSMVVRWTWTGSVLAFAHLCRQRRRPRAQLETCEFADQIAAICAKLWPVSWAALMGEGR